MSTTDYLCYELRSDTFRKATTHEMRQCHWKSERRVEGRTAVEKMLLCTADSHLLYTAICIYRRLASFINSNTCQRGRERQWGIESFRHEVRSTLQLILTKNCLPGQHFPKASKAEVDRNSIGDNGTTMYLGIQSFWETQPLTWRVCFVLCVI